MSLMVALGVASGAAGCVAHPATASGAAASGTTPAGTAVAHVTSGKAAQLSIPGGASVSLPAGSVRGNATVTAKAIAPPAPVPAGLVLDGRTWDIEVSGGSLTGPVTLRLPVPPQPGTFPGGQPHVALVAYFDTATRAWTPVPSSYDPATGTAVVSTPHLSMWAILSAGLNTLTAKEDSLLLDLVGLNSTAQQPACPGSAASAGVRVESSSGGLVKWCAGEEGGQPVLKVADNRSFGVEVDYPASWTVSRDGWPELDTALADGMASVLTVPPSGEKAVIIGGGDTVTFTIPAGTSGEASVIPSAQAFLWSAILFGVDTLVMTTEHIPFTKAPKTSTLTKAVQLIFTARDCASSFAGLARTQVTSASSAVSVFWEALKLASGCLDDEWEVAYGDSGAAASYVVGLALWLVSGLQLVGGGLYEAVESGVYWDGYRIAVLAAAPSCPSSSQLLTAWQTAPASVQQPWASPTTPITGFSAIQCWNGWVVAVPIGPGNGYFVFTQSGGLHLLSPAELQEFTASVCSSTASPTTWKSPVDGPANCQG